MDLSAFVTESNRIEGITRPPTGQEVDELEQFVVLGRVDRDAMIKLVGVFQPDARLRDQPGLNVRVGTHYPPLGGADIPVSLDGILERTNDGEHPYLVHHAYEALHPFTDGNGRSGRALWLWGMYDRTDTEFDRATLFGFLHSWYYQSLEFSRRSVRS
jgi:hypothetical protein